MVNLIQCLNFHPKTLGARYESPPTLTVGMGGGLHQRLGPEYISYCSPIRGFLAGFKQVLPSSFQISMVNGEQTCCTLWIQVAARNALRVQFGGYSIFFGGTWIHRNRFLVPMAPNGERSVRFEKRNLQNVCTFLSVQEPGHLKDLRR